MYVYHQSGCTPGLLNLLSSYLLCLRLCTPLITGEVFKNISRGCLWHVIYYFHFVPIVWFQSINQSINPADVSPILEVILTYGIQVKWHLENVI